MPTPTQIVNGGAGGLSPKLTRRTYSYSPSKGITARLDYRGNDIDKAIELFNAQVFSTTGAELGIEKGGVNVSLTYGHDPAGGTPASNALSLTQDRWEMPSEELLVSVWVHPVAYAAVASLSGMTTEAKIQAAIALLRGNSEKNPVATEDQMFGADAPAPFTSCANQTVKDFYALACSGSTTYRKSRPVIKHSTSVPAYWTRNVGSGNANRIYTHSQLLDEIGNAALWNQICPARLVYKATNIYDQNPTAKLGYTWGWLKNFTGECFSGNGRIEITCDYALDQWSTILYSAATF